MRIWSWLACRSWSSGYANNLGSLRNSWELIDYPERGSVRALPLLFMDD